MNGQSQSSASQRLVCGIEELPVYKADGVGQVLSLVDPDLADLRVFDSYPRHKRTILRFHDILAPRDGWIAPVEEHIEAILRFGEECNAAAPQAQHRRTLVHCHMGVSRSTAAMLILMAQAEADRHEDELYVELRRIRPQAWPNSRMVAYADKALKRDGRLTGALCRHYAFQLTARPEFSSWMPSLGRQIEIDMAMGAAMSANRHRRA